MWSRILGNTLSAKVSEKKFLQMCDDHCIIPLTLQSFKPSREYSRFLLYRGFCFIAALTNLATDLKHFMESEPRGKVGSFMTFRKFPNFVLQRM